MILPNCALKFDLTGSKRSLWSSFPSVPCDLLAALCAYELAAAPGVELARLVQRQHEIGPRRQLLDADAVVVEVVDHHGGRLGGAIARAQGSALQEGAAVAADEDVALLAECGGVAVAADRLDDLEVLERRDQLRRFNLDG